MTSTFILDPYEVRERRGTLEEACETSTTHSDDREHPRVSIIVPTLKESQNLTALLRRIELSMAELPYEVLIIDDDSADGTEELCGRLMRNHPLQLHVRHRPIGGLSGAVLEGFNRARGAIVVVMDADLQHPPEAIPLLIDALLKGRAEFAIGSRAAIGASIAGDWGRMRRVRLALCKAAGHALDRADRRPNVGFLRRVASGHRASGIARPDRIQNRSRVAVQVSVSRRRRNSDRVWSQERR